MKIILYDMLCIEKLNYCSFSKKLFLLIIISCLKTTDVPTMIKNAPPHIIEQLKFQKLFSLFKKNFLRRVHVRKQFRLKATKQKVSKTPIKKKLGLLNCLWSREKKIEKK